MNYVKGMLHVCGESRGHSSQCSSTPTMCSTCSGRGKTAGRNASTEDGFYRGWNSIASLTSTRSPLATRSGQPCHPLPVACRSPTHNGGALIRVPVCCRRRVAHRFMRDGAAQLLQQVVVQGNRGGSRGCSSSVDLSWNCSGDGWRALREVSCRHVSKRVIQREGTYGHPHARGYATGMPECGAAGSGKRARSSRWASQRRRRRRLAVKARFR